MADEVNEMHGEDTQPQGWTFPLFGCLGDCRRCACSYLCPCWLFNQNALRVGQKCGMCWWFVPGVNFVCCMRVRGRVRARRNIPGTCITDGCVHALCHPCALVQEARELDAGAREKVREMTQPYVDEQPKRASVGEEDEEPKDDAEGESMARS